MSKRFFDNLKKIQKLTKTNTIKYANQLKNKTNTVKDQLLNQLNKTNQNNNINKQPFNLNIKPLQDIIKDHSKINQQNLTQLYKKINDKLFNNNSKIDHNNSNNKSNSVPPPLINQQKKSIDISNYSKTIEQLKKQLQQKSTLTIQKGKQILQNKLQNIQQKLQQSKQQLKQQSQKAKQKLKQSTQKIYNNVSQKVDVKKHVKSTFDYIFWRVVLGLGLIAFAYGVGTSIPKEIIKAFLNGNENNDGKQRIKQN